MRILSITAQKPERTGSGIYLRELLKSFKTLGHEQALVAGIDKDDDISIDADIKFYPVVFNNGKLNFPVVGMSDEMPYESTRYKDLDEMKRGLFSAAFYECISKAVIEFKPDLIISNHLYYLTSLLKGWFPDIKVYGICHGSDLRQYNKNTIWPAYLREEIRKGISGLDRIYALNSEQKMMIEDMFKLSPESSSAPDPENKKVYVLGTGYDSSLFYPKKRIVFAGKLSEKKGVFALLRALKNLPYKSKSIEIMMCGGYSNEADLEVIKRLEDDQPYRVIRTGHVDHRTLAEILQRADLFILPSFSEGLPLVLLEAYACGTHVICTDLPGIKKWLDDMIPGNNAVFIKPPVMFNEDEVSDQQSKLFEQRIAEAIVSSLGEFEDNDKLSRLSFENLAKKILE